MNLEAKKQEENNNWLSLRINPTETMHAHPFLRIEMHQVESR